MNFSITIDIVATSTNLDPYLSFFEITVLPFEYANFPINYIKDEESIDCYTGKDNDTV